MKFLASLASDRVHTWAGNKVHSMIETHVFQVKNYTLTCSARATDKGRFEPTLVISKQVWPSRPRTIDVVRGAHPSVEVAIESARAQGVEWIANFG
jgi:hypothetical protein